MTSIAMPSPGKFYKTELHGGKSSRKDIDLIPSHWGDDLVLKYAQLSKDPFCRWEVIRQIYRNSALAQIVISSISDTISSLDFNIIATSDSDYWKNIARISKNEILSACGRRGGWTDFVAQFTEDLLVNPSGHFTQIVYDGNGMPYEIGGIGEKQPRPYYVVKNETYWGLPPRSDVPTLQTRQYDEVAGIYWQDDRVYRLPRDYYHQTVDGGRGSSAFLVGHSKAEKGRVRIWLSATLEEYFQRVASGTDQSGVLIMNNLAYASLAQQMKKRKEARKQPQTSTDDQGGILYVYNVSDKPGDAKWVSFRAFPDGLDIIKLLGLAEDMVAATFGVKSWRVDPSGGADGGKFGNAKKAVQLDAQEPGVQWVMGQLRSLMNNVFFSGMPILFQWAGGTNAADAIRLDNATKIAQAVSQTGNWLTVDEQRKLALDLGLPRRVLSEDTGVAASNEGITKTLHSAVIKTVDNITHLFDEYGLDEERYADFEGALKDIMRASFVQKAKNPPGTISYRVESAAFDKAIGDSLADLKRRATSMGEMVAAGHMDENGLKLSFAKDAAALITAVA